MIKTSHRCAVALVVALSAAGAASAGPEWVEQGDAGSLPASAQTISNTSSGTLTKISGQLQGNGQLGPGDLEDMYVIQITDPQNFSATTTFEGGGSAEFDSQLWLFRLDGTGLLGNDDTFIGPPPPGFGKGGVVSGSTLGPMATDNTGQTIPGPGTYLLAISGPFDVPFSDGGPIFSFGSSTEISGPDGAGGGLPITEWQNIGLSGRGSFVGNLGAYTISVTGAAPVPQTMLLSLDIKPGGCPNPFNRTSNGVLPVSLLGTPTFDVHTINKATVVMKRADGVGGSVPPHEGPPGPHSVYEDAGTPFFGQTCDCTDLEEDGITDLSMKFKSQDLVTILQLNDLPAGALVPVLVIGELNDGTAFTSTDCLRLVPPGTPPGLVSVDSNVKLAWVDAEPPDLQLDGGGFAQFQRTYPQSTVLTLTASPIASNHPFVGWQINGGAIVPGANLTITVSANTQQVKAVYDATANPTH